jgi:hypothetical protein
VGRTRGPTGAGGPRGTVILTITYGATNHPGNSSGPPSSVPSYIAVIVASHAAQSGSKISGNVAEVVIVKTNPGYASDPGHAGTGTVVGVLCG